MVKVKRRLRITKRYQDDTSTSSRKIGTSLGVREYENGISGVGRYLKDQRSGSRNDR